MIVVIKAGDKELTVELSKNGTAEVRVNGLHYGLAHWAKDDDELRLHMPTNIFETLAPAPSSKPLAEEDPDDVLVFRYRR